MKLDFNDILERNHIAASFRIPLRLTQLGPDDMGDHMTNIKPLIEEMVPSYRGRAKAMEECWERFCNTFRWNHN